MSIATDNVDCEIRRLILNNGRIPIAVEISRSDFSDLFMQGFIDEISPMAVTGNTTRQYYRGIRLDVLVPMEGLK